MRANRKGCEKFDSQNGAHCENGTQRIGQNQSFQVLAPMKSTVAHLNSLIQDLVNPSSDGQKCFESRDEVFRDGDRVMITENDRDRKCVNGDVGVLKIVTQYDNKLAFEVNMGDGRTAYWDTYASDEGRRKITLAYALTVHKSQGSEYDTVLIALNSQMQVMLNRNLLYTAISRARKKAVIYGDMQAIDTSMQKEPPKRKGMLVEKTLMKCSRLAV